ncbi:hypothetical protein VZT92_012554 [Zoarces viviparus]|uniref:Uncharacterized protein n=1 Tax=Zoarces viviparus TaxID=48416 RepID=A0AAW1F189_ZOAVI
MALANTQVKLLLTLQALLYEEIIRGCRELEAFIVRYDDTWRTRQHACSRGSCKPTRTLRADSESGPSAPAEPTHPQHRQDGSGHHWTSSCR